MEKEIKEEKIRMGCKKELPLELRDKLLKNGKTPYKCPQCKQIVITRCICEKCKKIMCFKCIHIVVNPHHLRILCKNCLEEYKKSYEEIKRPFRNLVL